MEFMMKVTQRLQGLRRFGRLLKEDGLINTTDLLVATGATVVLAAGVGSAALGTLSEAKYGKAQPDAQALGAAISQFYKDTGKWPGQAEHSDGATSGEEVEAFFLTTTTNLDFFPTGSDSAAAVETTVCKDSSLEGFLGVTINGGNVYDAHALGKVGNINDFLVTNPGPSYQNWKGPYLTGGSIESDPWDRAWVFNLQALYCAEDVSSAASVAADGGTTLGNAWILTAGNNRTLTSSFQGGGLDDDGDDAGVNMGKFVAKLVVAADAP